MEGPEEYLEQQGGGPHHELEGNCEGSEEQGEGWDRHLPGGQE